MANPTLAHLAEQAHGGDILTIINTLTQRNELMATSRWQQGNGSGAHVYTVTASLPTASWRAINAGVDPTRGVPSQKSVAYKHLTLRSNVDKKYVDFATDAATVRSNQDLMNAYGLGLSFADSFLYGDGSGNDIIGLAEITETNDTVVTLDTDATSGTSIYVVQWESDRVYMAYPNNVQVPVEMIDLGLTNVVDGSGKQFTAYVTEFGMTCGLVVEDPRTVWRIDGIDPFGDHSTLFDAMLDVIYQLPTNAPADIYVNPTMAASMAKEAYGKNNHFYYADQVGGVPVLNFHGQRIRLLEAIANDEVYST